MQLASCKCLRSQCDRHALVLFLRFNISCFYNSRKYFMSKKSTHVALCLRGAICKYGDSFVNQGGLYRHGRYTNYVSVYNSIKKHIIQSNPLCHFDVFLQGWNLDLESKMCFLYKPKKWLFEDNNIYSDDIKSRCSKIANDYSGISQALAIKKSIELIDGDYDYVILYRPDVLLWKDMLLEKYDSSKIYVNAHANANGDFHFVMNQKNAIDFCGLYDSPKKGNFQQLHAWIKRYVHQFMGKNLEMDDIIPSIHQEVLRKIFKNCHIDQRIPFELFRQYGLTEEDIRNLPPKIKLL